MRPLLITCVVISGIAFAFNNYFIPVAELKMQTMKYDIIVSKPAFDIKEGVFYDKIDGYVIKIGKKEKDGSTIRDILIYQQNFDLQDNIIVAEKGKMVITPDKKFLEFDLENGWNYRERGPHNTTNTEFIRMGFKEYKKVFDLSSFKLNKTDDNTFKNNYQMLNMRQLSTVIDSLEKVTAAYRTKTSNDLKVSLRTLKYLDSPWISSSAVPAVHTTNFRDLLPDSAKNYVLDRAIAVANNIKMSQEQSALLFDNDRKNLRLHLMAWHEKLTMSIACLVLFLIGAPLGSIIRKGGIGLPLVFAVVFFVIFFLLINFGRKLVKEDVLQPISGMWMATYVLVPVGMFLTYKALHDSQLFNKEFYFRIIKKLKMARDKEPAGAQPSGSATSIDAEVSS
jgi:lipopolysaccharide export system permease protein